MGAKASKDVTFSFLCTDCDTDVGFSEGFSSYREAQAAAKQHNEEHHGSKPR